MNIFVCIKQVPDTATRIKLKEDNSGIDDTRVEWILNPYDEFALEEALHIKEQHGGKIRLFSMGPKRVENALRRGLAMGADEAYQIESPSATDPAFAAAALAQAIQSINIPPDLILMGKVGVDENHQATGPMLAEHLHLNHIGFVNHPTLIQTTDSGGYTITVKRLMHGQTEEIQTPLPLLITVDKGIGEPRYPSLTGIIQAKKKPVQNVTVTPQENLSKIKFHSYRLPDKKPDATMLSGSPEEQAKKLVHLLKTKEKVL